MDVKINFLRIDTLSPTKTQGTRHLYVFKCAKVECNNEVKVRKHIIEKQSGLCKSCNMKSLFTGVPSSLRKRPFESKYNKFWQRCLTEKIECDILYEDYLIFTRIENCHYCEDKIPWTPFGDDGGHYLDRKDNTKGHTQDNVVVCCADCNWTKSNMYTYEEFLLLAPILKQIKLLRKTVQLIC